MDTRIISFSLTLILFLTSNSECARILGIFHMPSYSHFILGETLLKELARNGHQVTMISSFPQKTPVPNYRDIPLEKLPKELKKRREKSTMFDFLKTPTFMIPFFMGRAGLDITEVTLQEPSVQDLLKSNEKFDLVIVEQFLNEAHKGFAHHFNASLIVLSTIGSSLWINHLVGNPQPYAFTPDIFLSYSTKMNFLQRVKNTLILTLSKLYDNLYYFRKQNELLQKYFPNAPHINDVMYNTSLILMNSHISTNPPLPHLPNMIEVGGLHIKEGSSLPSDLQKFLDNSENGVIYFSMGSNIEAETMEKEKLEQIFSAISKLKMNVLWKFGNETFPNMPKNLKISKWFPQQSVLAHPNVKLFITHGGLLSTMESLYFGLPLLGIPVFGDQRMNMAISDEMGISITIGYNDLNGENFYLAITELLNNPKYSENAKIRSKIHRDRQAKPLETAVYWVEYILRHKGAKHFRSVALDLQWYQYLLLDVLVFLAVISVIISTTILYLVRYILKKKQIKLKKQ